VVTGSGSVVNAFVIGKGAALSIDRYLDNDRLLWGRDVMAINELETQCYIDYRWRLEVNEASSNDCHLKREL
jgi:hypothetical protein